MSILARWPLSAVVRTSLNRFLNVHNEELTTQEKDLENKYGHGMNCHHEKFTKSNILKPRECIIFSKFLIVNMRRTKAIETVKPLQ